MSSTIPLDDPSKTIRVTASTPSGKDIPLAFTTGKVIGSGSFGIVFQAHPQGDTLQGQVAIKKVLQDRHFKNRELQVTKVLSHPNVVELKAYFYSNGDRKADELYLNLVLEYVPETLYRATRHYVKLQQIMPTPYIRLYMYQLFRALAYIHCLGICHRDIKPQNLLLNPHTGVLKLCDFGSAKILVAKEPNVSYICSRYYRAPELIFGATNYTTSIDLWSTACVMGELMLSSVLFAGDTSVDQLIEIIKILGTPTKEQIKLMNPSYMEHKFPQIKPQSLNKVFRSKSSPEAIDLMSKLLQYTPGSRLSAVEAMCHPFFDDLRNGDGTMANGKPAPELFNFTKEELSIRPDLNSKLIPASAEAGLAERGIDMKTFQPLSAQSMLVTLD